MHEHVTQCYLLDHLGPCVQILNLDVLGAMVSFGYFQPENDFTRVQTLPSRYSSHVSRFAPALWWLFGVGNFNAVVLDGPLLGYLYKFAGDIERHGFQCPVAQ